MCVHVQGICAGIGVENSRILLPDMPFGRTGCGLLSQYRLSGGSRWLLFNIFLLPI